MKAVLLAGGQAKRLAPLTTVTNKHLLPLYNKPVIFYAIEKIVASGIDRIMVVTSPRHIEDFVNLLGSGTNFISPITKKRIQIVYGIQDAPSGIADGLYIAKDYIGDDSVLLYLGDNIIEDNLAPYVKNFKTGAVVFLKPVKDAHRFGVAHVDKKGVVLGIEEKPKVPKSDLAVAGVYLYDNTVFRKMIGQKVSARGEFEITFVNNKYIAEKKLKAVTLKKEWFDVGTFDSLLEAGNYMKGKYEKS